MKIKAYHRELCVTPEQVELLPQITPHLKTICTNLHKKGLPSDIWYYLSACSEPSVAKIRVLRARVNQYHPPVEVLCAAAEVDPGIVLTAFMQTVDRLSSYAVHASMSGGKKQVIESLIDTASMNGPDGDTSRLLFMKATGLLPQPKGAQTLIQVTQNSTPQAVVVAPSPENIIKRLSDRFNALPPLIEDADVLEEESSPED
jgi:hypothetical protein